MCAIVGLIRRPQREFKLPQLELARWMLSRMGHRGPDSNGILEYENVVLGHNRLSIIGIENGQQPISDGRVDIAVNGEFYRHDELKAKLFSRRSWTTDSDSEILIPLYEEFGIDRALEILDGEFAFILHDREKKRVYAARDRFGVKPLSFRDSGSGVEIASEVRAFYGAKSWNIEALCTGLAMHYPNLEQTIAEGINNVLPGTYLEIDSETGNILSCKRWWKPEWSESKIKMDLSTTGRRFKDLFSDAVRARMRSDARWCVSLSGGIDSSAVLAFASEANGSPIDSFTVSFPDAGDLAWNELDIARRTAKAVGSRLHEVEMPASRMLDLLEEAIDAGEGFAVNGHIACKCALAKAVNQAGFKTMLVGEGADECLLGYSHLKVDQFGKQFASKLMAGTETPNGECLMLESFKSLEYIPSFLQAKLSTGKEIETLLDDDFKVVFESEKLFRQCRTLQRCMIGSCRAEKTMGAWLATAFPTYICKILGDGQEMHSSIEARLPFLDKDLFKFAASLPLELKSSSNNEKMVLREASRGIVPDEVRLRPKQPFQAPPLSALLSDSQWKKFIDICTAGSSKIFNKKKLETALLEVRKLSLEEQAKHESTFMLAASCSILSRKLSF